MYRERTNAYWRKRAEEQLTFIEQQSMPFLRQVDKVYLDARRANLEAVKDLYIAYYTKEGFDISALTQIAPRGDILRFQEAVRAAGLSSQLPDGYAFRLTRLELLEANIWLEVKKAGLIQTSIQGVAHYQTYETAYKYALYTLSKGTGYAPSFSMPNERTINRILNTKFYGKNYSDRVWSNTNKLARELKNVLATSITTGQSQTKTARMIRERYDVTRYEASRLIRTETSRFNDQAANDSYKGIGIERWVYLATLDSKTSDTCGSFDNQIFPIDGGPSIPIHPGCRCTRRAYLGKEYEPDERIMRDENGKNRYIGQISFDDWQKLYL